jgi:hypothetical protein
MSIPLANHDCSNIREYCSVSTAMATHDWETVVALTVTGGRTAKMTLPKRPRDPNQLAKLIADLTTRTMTEFDPTRERIRKLCRAAASVA